MNTQALVPGIYEQLVNTFFATSLARADADATLRECRPLDASESAVVIAGYLSAILRQGLEAAGEERAEGEGGAGRIAAQLRLANRIIALVREATGNEELDGYFLNPARPEQLLALLPRGDTRRFREGATRLPRPASPLSRATLFIGEQNEQSLAEELSREILSCDRVDLCVSFIRWTGLRLLMPSLEAFSGRGGQVRVLCSTYMGATEAEAVDRLAGLGGNVRVRISYEDERTRMHAKAYLFHRDTHFSTAYVGSSNLSAAAITRGLEWNVKIAEQEQPDLFRKIGAAFESSWDGGAFEDYDSTKRGRLDGALRAARLRGRSGADGVAGTAGPLAFAPDVRPLDYQRAMLDAIEADRVVRHLDRSLLVAATGTGKTVVAALDYRHFRSTRRKRGLPARLLFVAHREEILQQSLACFRTVLGDQNFGELFVGRERPRRYEDLFMSIQTFTSRRWQEETGPDQYDYIVVDEFHHAAAGSYQPLLRHYRPAFWLGLTATPERRDGEDVVRFFGGRLSYELRLPEAVERGMLCPFQYFGVSDCVDYERDVVWRAGSYDVQSLDRVYTMDQVASEKRARLVLDAVGRYLGRLSGVHCVAFCASVAHARYMAAYFCSRGLQARALAGEDDARLRRETVDRFRRGELPFLFVVDIFNEGIDIPAIDTILFLRPTESLTVFLQQLGRGLRLHEGKECLTVLDFVGRANRHYRFGEKLAALLLPQRRESLRRCVEEGRFACVPQGCSIRLEPVARDHVLANLDAWTRGRTSILVQRIRDCSESLGRRPTLSEFLDGQGMAAQDLYRHGRSYARLCVAAGVREDFHEEDEATFDGAWMRLCAIDSRRWLGYLRDLLPHLDGLRRPEKEEEMRMLQMLYFSFWQEIPKDVADAREHVCASLRGLARNPVLLEELGELLGHALDSIRFVDLHADLGFACPLDVHCTYTRDQILAAMDMLRPSSMRQGVCHVAGHRIDLFFVTLEKSEREFSATTCYEDYAMGDRRFHWQSQSTTPASSPTALRYINHRSTGDRILLFVRNTKHNRYGRNSPYLFLGPVSYVSHEGSRPVSFVWELEHPIPARFVAVANKMTA